MMKMDAEALYNDFPSPRRYSFGEHAAVCEQMSAVPAVSPEELEISAGGPSVM